SPAEFEGEINPALLTSDDKWILLRLDQAIREVSDALASYNFSTAVQALYRFFWSEYCDWYIEASKAALGKPVPESSPSPLQGERAGVRGASESDAGSKQKTTPPHPDPLPPSDGAERESRRQPRRVRTRCAPTSSR
ncbi:MAG: class I tRNA ligase family protein, partial [Rhodobacteraceae bacterium]|nr:class I tRNA ligase family protein [Paracoccaceae bacterium]